MNSIVEATPLGYLMFRQKYKAKRSSTPSRKLIFSTTSARSTNTWQLQLKSVWPEKDKEVIIVQLEIYNTKVLEAAAFFFCLNRSDSLHEHPPDKCY